MDINVGEERDVWSGPVFSLMRILINPAEAALRPPRFIRAEKPVCQERARKEGGAGSEGGRSWRGGRGAERRGGGQPR